MSKSAILGIPAHLKSSLLGVSFAISITAGKLILGTCQGIYLGEHRNHSSSVMATIIGEGDEI